MNPPVVFWSVLVIAWIGFWLLSGVLGVESDGAIEAEGLEVVEGAASGLSLLGLLGSLGLNRVPLPVAATAVSLCGWLVTMLVVQLAGGEVATVWAVVIFVLSVPVALATGGGLVRPLGPIYETNPAMSQHELIGRICTVRSGRVDAGFGQAVVTDADGAAHVIHVRFPEANELTAGSKALIVDVDDGVFRIDPDTAGLE